MVHTLCKLQQSKLNVECMDRSGMTVVVDRAKENPAEAGLSSLSKIEVSDVIVVLVPGKSTRDLFRLLIR